MRSGTVSASSISMPRHLRLTDAVSEIKSAFDAATAYGDRHPFFFIVGAGISHPEIPSTTEIIRECQILRGAAESEKLASGPSAAELYSREMRRAFPQPIDRQRYFEKVVMAAKISYANLALAHVLSEGSLANLVVTPNFDDLLSRALRIFGKPPIVCDHPATVSRIDPVKKHIQVVHVHGSYQFYDITNLTEEITFRARIDPLQSPGMSDLLTRVMWDTSPIVIGYAGWEHDPIMMSLRRRIQSGFQRNVYWFCYSQEAYNVLPDWLRSNPSVCFVLPDDAFGAAAIERNDDEALPVVDDAQSTPPKHDQKSAKRQVLPARMVLSELITALQLPAPSLTQEPLDFYADSLAAAVSEIVEPSGETELYHLSEVLARIRRGAECERTGSVRETALRQLYDASRRAAHSEVVGLAENLEFEKLPTSDVREVAYALRAALEAIKADHPRFISGWERLVQIADFIKEKDEEPDDRVFAVQVRHLAAKGYEESGDPARAIESYQKLIAAYDDDPDIDIQRWVAAAYLNGAYLLANTKPDEAAKIYDETFRRFARSADDDARETAAMCGRYLGSLQAQQGLDDRAIAIYDEVLRTFQDEHSHRVEVVLAATLEDEVGVYLKLGDFEKATERLDAFVGRFDSSTDAQVAESLAEARLEIATALSRLPELRSRAIPLLNGIVDRYGGSNAPNVRHIVATAYLQLANVARYEQRLDDALVGYALVIDTFASALEPLIQRRVAAGRYLRAEVLDSLNRRGDAIRELEILLDTVGASSDPAIMDITTRGKSLLVKLRGSP